VAADVLKPENWVIALVCLLGWKSGGLAGVCWGLLVGLFAAILPVLFVQYGIRHWQWTSRNVSVRRERLAALGFIVASDATGVLTLLALRAPRAMTGYLAAMLVTSAVITAITFTWKISVHCVVASATVALVALTYGAVALLGLTLVALVAWSRVRLRAHTTAQVMAGALLGAAAGTLTFLAVS
jgi:membrane-associated phospholipid phosphatase